MLETTIDDVQAHLPEILSTLKTGERIAVTENGVEVAQIVNTAKPKVKPKFGSAKGMLIIVSEDDDHLKDFAEYMP